MNTPRADSHTIRLYLSGVYEAKVSVSKSAGHHEKMAGCTWLEVAPRD